MKAKSSAKETPAYVDGRLLKPVRKIARRSARRELSVKETSLRGFWGQWDQEINVLKDKIDPLLEKIYQCSGYPQFSDDVIPEPFEIPEEELDLKF